MGCIENQPRNEKGMQRVVGLFLQVNLSQSYAGISVRRSQSNRLKFYFLRGKNSHGSIQTRDTGVTDCQSV